MYSSDDEVYTDIFFFNDTATTEIYTLSLHDALPIYLLTFDTGTFYNFALAGNLQPFEELKVLIEEAIEEKRILSKKKEVKDRKKHTSELQSRQYLVCRLLLEKKKNTIPSSYPFFTTI